MPMHDWTRVEAGIYHDFHHEWISAIKRSLNQVLPEDFYALAEQQAAGFGPDVLTLQHEEANDIGSSDTTTLARPQTTLFQETTSDFYMRKQNAIAIRHVSGDRVVAMIVWKFIFVCLRALVTGWLLASWVILFRRSETMESHRAEQMLIRY